MSHLTFSSFNLLTDAFCLAIAALGAVAACALLWSGAGRGRRPALAPVPASHPMARPNGGPGPGHYRGE